MIRRLLVAVVLVVGFTTVGMAAPAQAYSQCAANTECGWLFYTDSTMTHFNGLHTTNCQGIVLNEGIQQGYSVFVSEGCGGGIIIS